MNGKKRWLAVILCALMLTTALTACTGGPTTPSSAPSSAAAPAEKVKITYSCWGTVEENKATQTTIDSFNKSQNKIEVSLMLIPWESYVAQLNTMAAAGNLPDSANVKEEMVKAWASKGMLADVSSMYSAQDQPLDCVTFKGADGKPVAYACAAETMVMYYNKDMFDKAGVAYPPTSVDKAWTWDQFVANAKKLTLDKNGKHPDEAGFDAQNITQYGALVENLVWQLEWPVLSNGGGFVSADGSKLTIGEPSAIDAIQKVADLYLKDHVAPLSTGATDDGVSRGLIAGTVAMTTNGTWNVGTCLDKAKKEGLKYGIAVLPKLKNYSTIATGGTSAVFQQSKHQAEAIEWAKYLVNIDNAWDGLVATGIWPPIFKKYYTDETLTKKWLNNPNFPTYDDYKSVVVDTTVNTQDTHPTAWMYAENTADLYPLVNSILGDVWTGKATAQSAITSNLDKLQAAFAGKK